MDNVGRRWFFNVVYACPDSSLCKGLWDTLEAISDNNNSGWIAMGDLIL